MNNAMNRARRTLFGLWVGAACMVGGTSAVWASDPADKATDTAGSGEAIAVHVLVLEAERSGSGIDPRLAKVGLSKELKRLGYLRAKVLDELNARVEKGARVTLQMPSRRQNLQVKLLHAEARAKKFRLRLAIPEERFVMTTNHKDGGTVLIFLPPGRSRPDIGLAVTPRP